MGRIGTAQFAGWISRATAAFRAQSRRPHESQRNEAAQSNPELAATILHVLDQGALVVALYDARDQLVYANPVFREMFLRGHQGPIGFADILRHGFRHGLGVRIDCGDVEAFLHDVLTRRRRSAARAFEADLVDGRWLHMTETVLADGWFLSVAVDITPLKQQEHSLRRAHETALQASLTDALTTLPNRRHMLELCGQALAEHRLNGRPLSLALIDLDHFKTINDRYGHDGGDEVLRQFSALCRRQLRPQDYIGRLGGEEFMLLLPGLRQPDAVGVLERLRTGIPALALAASQPPLQYTFSAGLAEAVGVESPESLMKRADRALYAAKSGGRDRIETAEPC